MSDLHTERLALLPFTLDRVNAAVAGRDALADLLGITVATGWPQPDFAAFLPFLAAALAADPDESVWTRLIVHTADRIVIGVIGTKGPPDAQNARPGAVEIGYDVVPAYQGHGFATEAARAFVAWLSSRPDVSRITAECLADNVASIRVLEKAGMRQLEPDGTMLRWELPP